MSTTLFLWSSLIATINLFVSFFVFVVSFVFIVYSVFYFVAKSRSSRSNPYCDDHCDLILLLMLTGHSKRMMRGSGNVDGMVFNLQHYPYVTSKNYTPYDTTSSNLPVTAYNFHGETNFYTEMHHELSRKY